MPERKEPTFVKSDRDERLWSDAKKSARARGFAAGTEKFYRYANATLQHMRLRTGSKDYRRKLKTEQRRVEGGGNRYESLIEAVRSGADPRCAILEAVAGAPKSLLHLQSTSEERVIFSTRQGPMEMQPDSSAQFFLDRMRSDSDARDAGTDKQFRRILSRMQGYRLVPKYMDLVSLSPTGAVFRGYAHDRKHYIVRDAVTLEAAYDRLETGWVGDDAEKWARALEETGLTPVAFDRGI